MAAITFSGTIELSAGAWTVAATYIDAYGMRKPASASMTPTRDTPTDPSKTPWAVLATLPDGAQSLTVSFHNPSYTGADANLKSSTDPVNIYGPGTDIEALVLPFIRSSRFPADAGGESYGLVAGETIPGAGYPVTIDRSSGLALRALAGPYDKAFVCGLAESFARPGSQITVRTGQLVLPDWSGPTGEASLALGLPYFLSSTGQILKAPQAFGAAAVTLVGYARTARMLDIRPQPPIKL